MLKKKKKKKKKIGQYTHISGVQASCEEEKSSSEDIPWRITAGFMFSRISWDISVLLS